MRTFLLEKAGSRSVNSNCNGTIEYGHSDARTIRCKDVDDIRIETSAIGILKRHYTHEPLAGMLDRAAFNWIFQASA